MKRTLNNVTTPLARAPFTIIPARKCPLLLLFTGREYAANFGFYEYRARAYNPTLGRFMSEDPKLFDAGDYNLYRYCHNDPLDMTDPMGLLPEPGKPPPTPPPRPQQQGPHYALGNDRTRTTRPYASDRTPVGAQDQHGMQATSEHVFVSATPFTQKFTQGSGNARLGVGNPVDAHFLSQFGFHGQQARDMTRFANAMVYGVAYPAAAAVAVPVLPLYGHVVLGGARYVPQAAKWGAPIAGALFRAAETISEDPRTSLADELPRSAIEQPYGRVGPSGSRPGNPAAWPSPAPDF